VLVRVNDSSSRDSILFAFCVLCGRKRRLESLQRTREQKLSATLSDKIKIVQFLPAKWTKWCLKSLICPKYRQIWSTSLVWNLSVSLLCDAYAQIRYILPSKTCWFRNKPFCQKLGLRSSLTRMIHWLRRQKTRARPNPIFLRSTQHYYTALTSIPDALSSQYIPGTPEIM
jgi:hypothetical protein